MKLYEAFPYLVIAVTILYLAVRIAWWRASKDDRDDKTYRMKDFLQRAVLRNLEFARVVADINRRLDKRNNSYRIESHPEGRTYLIWLHHSDGDEYDRWVIPKVDAQPFMQMIESGYDLSPQIGRAVSQAYNASLHLNALRDSIIYGAVYDDDIGEDAHAWFWESLMHEIDDAYHEHGALVRACSGAYPQDYLTKEEREAKTKAERDSMMNMIKSYSSSKKSAT